MVLLISSQLAYGSGLSRSDIADNPEYVCMNYGDEPEMKDLCDWINVCDDTGEVNSTHGFCTGLAVSNPPGRASCPPGFHSTEDDESGLCYKNMGPTGCEYEDLIMRPNKGTCGYIVDVCQKYPNLSECKVTIDLGIPGNEDYNCEWSVPDHCFEIYKPSQQLSNGTFTKGTSLNCDDVNATDFRVTLRDGDRHDFDKDFDGIGCEKAFQDIRKLIYGDN